LVAVEAGHDGAELGKVSALLRTLGLTVSARPGGAVAGRSGRTWLTAADAAEAIRDELARDDTGFALRMLGRALADLRDLTHADDHALFLAEPSSTGDHRWDTLLAAAIEGECRRLDIPAPAWTRVAALSTWWFPVADPVLTARTIQRTPVEFAARGIWLDRAALTVV
jgi:hypothetical protein